MMNKLFLTTILLLSLTFFAFSQERTKEIKLMKGQVISSTMEMNTKASRGEQGTMTTSMTTVSKLKVVAVRDKDYLLASSVDKLKMDFEGFGMNQSYDSEDKDAKPNMMSKQLEKMLNAKENVNLGKDGKLIKQEEDEDVKGGKRSRGGRKGGMMQMFGGGGNVADAIAGSFLIIPADKKEGDKWRVTSEKDGLKTITEYTFNGIMGNAANVTANQQIKGQIVKDRQGMLITSDVNRLSTMTLLVDLKTGLITMQTIDTKDKSVTSMNGKVMNSDGVTTITITNEIVTN